MKEIVSELGKKSMPRKLGGHGDSVIARETIKMQRCLARKKEKKINKGIRS